MKEEEDNLTEYQTDIEKRLWKIIEAKRIGATEEDSKNEIELHPNDAEIEGIKRAVFSILSSSKPRKFRPGSVLEKKVFFAPNFEELKNEYDRRVNEPMADEKEVKDYFFRLIDNLLRGDNEIASLYSDLRQGAKPPIFKKLPDYYKYFSLLYAIEELTRFESFVRYNSRPPLKNILESEHPPHDSNLWAKDTYELFKYLYENFYLSANKTKNRLVAVWFYLKMLQPKYGFQATKKSYKKWLLEKYDVEIKNDDKPDNFQEVFLPQLNRHRMDFEELNGSKYQ